ncbi:MAG: hypothetical protein KDJ26_03150 [Alphaproteobacteria bacterium]|nr:hypothetical protein [Alphaproteobacteria bacterium]MCB9984193.1 hypothetical protein [Micavibrio sp.]
MFGMLDYRAHKLYWLLALPLRAIYWFLAIFILIASCLWASSVVDNVVLRLLLSYVAMEIGIVIFGLFWNHVILRIHKAVFLFFIDIEPFDGRTIEQAREVLEYGKTAIILQKPHSKITDDDFDFLLKNNWMGRIFFSDKIRRRQYIISQKAKALVLESGEDMNISDYELQSIMKEENLEQPWYEVALTNGNIRNMIILHIVFILIFIIAQN